MVNSEIEQITPPTPMEIEKLDLAVANRGSDEGPIRLDNGTGQNEQTQEETIEALPVVTPAAQTQRSTSTHEAKVSKSEAALLDVPGPEDENYESYMAQLAADTERIFQAQLKQNAESKRATTGATTSYHSQGSFAVEKTSNLRITAVLNRVLDNFNNLAIQRTHISRYDIQFQIDPSDEPTIEIYETLLIIFKKIASIDK